MKGKIQLIYSGGNFVWIKEVEIEGKKMNKAILVSYYTDIMYQVFVKKKQIEFYSLDGRKASITFSHREEIDQAV